MPTEVEENNPIDILNSYPVDITFVLNRYRGDLQIVASVNINVNNEENMPGYSITTTGMCFEFDKTAVLSKDQNQMLQISGLSICITNLRSYIANQTSYFLGAVIPFMLWMFRIY